MQSSIEYVQSCISSVLNFSFSHHNLILIRAGYVPFDHSCCCCFWGGGGGRAGGGGMGGLEMVYLRNSRPLMWNLCIKLCLVNH